MFRADKKILQIVENFTNRPVALMIYYQWKMICRKLCARNYLRRFLPRNHYRTWKFCISGYLGKLRAAPALQPLWNGHVTCKPIRIFLINRFVLGYIELGIDFVRADFLRLANELVLIHVTIPLKWSRDLQTDLFLSHQ